MTEGLKCTERLKCMLGDLATMQARKEAQGEVMAGEDGEQGLDMDCRAGSN